MDKWSKEETAELKKFWNGKIGKKYIKRIEDTKTQLLQAAMGSVETEAVTRYAWIANGFDSILQEIEAIVNNVEDFYKKVEAKEEE